MTEAVNPRTHSALAANQMILALIEARAIGVGKEFNVYSEDDANKVSEAIITLHKNLNEYFKTL